MVRSKPSHSKKQPKQRGVDFKKIKRKVGRKLPPPKNATNTEIKSKAIVLPEQSVASEKVGLAVNKKGLTLKELLQQTSHHNAKVRRDALSGIRDLFLKHPEELRLHSYAVIEKLRERIGDDDKLVRETFYQLLRSVIFPCCKEGNQGPLVSLLMAYIFNAMTHLAADVRLMAFRFLDLIVQYYPPTFLLHAEKILQNYENILRKNQLFVQDRGKLKTALGGLVHCLSLLPCNDQREPSSEKDVAGQGILHGFEPDDVQTTSSGYSLIIDKLKELLPVLISCLKEILSLASTMPSLELQSFDCMLSILMSISSAIKFSIWRIYRAESNLQNISGGAKVMPLDHAVTPVILGRLLSLFPLNVTHHVSKKDGERYFVLNILIAEVFLNCSEWISPPVDTSDRFMEFIESVLLGEERDGAKIRGTDLLLPFIPKLLSQVANSWKSRLLQAFTTAFKNCNHESSLKSSFISVIEKLIIPGQDVMPLDASHPEVLDHLIAWVRELPLLLILLGEKHPSVTKVVLRLILHLGQCASSTALLAQEYDNMQHPLEEFFSPYQQKGGTKYGPFIRLPEDCQELAVCCLYYFSHLDSAILKALVSCCLCNNLEPSILFRIIEVLDSAYVAGHIWIADIISFFITLLSRFKISSDSIHPTKDQQSKVSNRGTFRLLTRVVCSCMLHIGDEYMVLQMLEKLIIGQIQLKLPHDNGCAMLRLLITLDSRPTRLSQESINYLGSFMASYLVDIFHAVIRHIPRDDDEAAVAGLEHMAFYYVLPCLLLFDRSHKLTKLVLNTMGSMISQRSLLPCSGDHGHARNHSDTINAVVYALQLMHKDKKIQQILCLFRAELESISRNISLLQASAENNMTLEERHETQVAHARLDKLLSNLSDKIT